MTMTLSGSGTITGLVAGGLPDATITQPDLATGVAGTGPAFSAYMVNGSANQSVTSGVATKVIIDTEDFDTNSNFDSTTNYRFTPTVAGYYLITGQVYGSGSSITVINSLIYKNGSVWATGGVSTTGATRATCSAVIYFNGSTDYVELYGSVTATSPVFGFSGRGCMFSGCLVRAA